MRKLSAIHRPGMKHTMLHRPGMKHRTLLAQPSTKTGQFMMGNMITRKPVKATQELGMDESVPGAKRLAVPDGPKRSINFS